MTPEDVLIEAIATASLQGDSSILRQQMCQKLVKAIEESQPRGNNGEQTRH